MELTFERGTLDGAMRADIDAFYGDVFGWEAKDIDLLDQKCHFLRIDEGQFILLAESKKPMSSRSFIATATTILKLPSPTLPSSLSRNIEMDQPAR